MKEHETGFTWFFEQIVLILVGMFGGIVNAILGLFGWRLPAE